MCRRDSRGDSAMGHLALKGWEDRNPYVINPTAVSEVKPNPGPHSSPVSLHSPLQGERRYKACGAGTRGWPQSTRVLFFIFHDFQKLLFLDSPSSLLFPSLSSLSHSSHFLLPFNSFKRYLNKAGNTSMKYVKNTFSANIY